MLTNLLAIGATLFVSSASALPAPEAPASDFSFHAQVQQHCNHYRAATSLMIPRIHAGRMAFKPNDGNRTSITTPWTIKGLAKDLVVDFQDGAVTCKYYALCLHLRDC